MKSAPSVSMRGATVVDTGLGAGDFTAGFADVGCAAGFDGNEAEAGFTGDETGCIGATFKLFSLMCFNTSLKRHKNYFLK